MDLEYELIIPELVLAGFATLIVALAITFRQVRQEVWGYLSAAGLLILLVLTAVFYINENDDFANVLAIDNFTVLFRVLFLGIAMFAILAGIQFAGERLRHQGEFYGLIMFATLGMILLAASRELITAYLSLELMSFSLYILVGFNKLNPFSNEASLKYMLLGAFSSALFLYGLSMLYGITGTTTYSGIEPDGVEAGRNIAQQLGNFSAVAIDSTLPLPGDVRPGLIVALVLIVAGLSFKVSAVPFHQWTPDAYQGAPLPVTAFLSAAGKAAAFAFFLRFFAEALLPAAEEWAWLIALIAAMTMITGNLMALRQTNLKRLMAYSSISQVGYLLIGIVALNADTLTQSQDAATALVLHLVGYAATNLLVFTALLAFFNRTGKDDIRDLRGLAQRQPFLALILAVALFSLAGMPLFAGFATKFIIFQVAVSNGYLWLGALGVTASFVSLYYYLMVIKQMYLYEPEGEDTARFSVPVPMIGALSVLTGVVFLIGLFPAPLFNAIDDSTELLFLAHVEATPGAVVSDEAEEVAAETAADEEQAAQTQAAEQAAGDQAAEAQAEETSAAEAEVEEQTAQAQADEQAVEEQAAEEQAAQAQAEEESVAEAEVEEQAAQAQAEVDAQAEEQAVEEQATPPPAEVDEPAAPEEEEPPAAVAADPARDQQVFFQNGCNLCHGDAGEGGIGPTLAQTGFSVQQDIDQYRSPRGVMPPFPESVIPDEDVAAIHAWLQTLPLPDVIVPGEGTPVQ